MAVTVEILPAAQGQLDAADERWVDEHGLFADNPLFEQISHARTLLADNPQLGKIARRGRTTIYKLVLSSGWKIYYRYFADRKLVEIVAIWYSARGDEPPL
ncbi:MAG TPA: type II toxin-antitoxin system RelE/ParE family toxin [Kofleriaceae bacterium]|nr:type II toxin-antitoxin system RelE/ParE family toxin [Kofleriaceae bacterium]